MLKEQVLSLVSIGSIAAPTCHITLQVCTDILINFSGVYLIQRVDTILVVYQKCPFPTPSHPFTAKGVAEYLSTR